MILDFFYNSLDTLKQVKKPTKKDIINMVIAIFIVVILSWLYFVFTDSVFLNLYKAFNTIMTSK